MFENKKILIVDDEEQARLYLANIVGELYPGLSIQLAATPADALFILKKEHIHTVLLDVELPGMFCGLCPATVRVRPTTIL